MSSEQTHREHALNTIDCWRLAAAELEAQAARIRVAADRYAAEVGGRAYVATVGGANV